MAGHPAMPILWLLAGEAYDDLGQQELAVEAFAKAAELDPECAVAFSQLAFCLVDLRRLTEAEQAALKSIALKPSGPRYSLLGVILRNLGRDDDAIEAYRRSLELDPNNDEVIVNLAIAMHLRGDDLAASRLLERAVRDYPENAAAHRELGYQYLMKAERDTAERLLLRSAELDRSNPWTAIYLGSLYCQQGEHAKAEAEYRHACELAPGAAWARYWYGDLLWEQGRLDEAEQQYRKAVELDPDDPTACWDLGYFLMRTGGAMEDGGRWLKRALDLYPEHIREKKSRELFGGRNEAEEEK